MMRWFLICILSVNINISHSCFYDNFDPREVCLYEICQSLGKGDISVLQKFEGGFVKMSVDAPSTFVENCHVSFLYRKLYRYPDSEFLGLNIYASKSEVSTEGSLNTSTFVTVQLPKTLPVDGYHKLAFNMVSLPQEAASVLVNSSDYLFNNTLVGLSVAGRDVSGLKEMVNISMNVSAIQMKTHSPQCVFLNYSTQTLETDGCLTQWEPGQPHVICSCNHLTFFGVLMISNKETTQISSVDKENLNYITFVGCSISFCALAVSVVLFITNRRVRSDVSMRIHVNLAIALLLLNMHFLPNTAIGIWTFSWPSPGFCVYLAVALHFSLLTSFSWMAVEGFHLYLLLIKVFNIYVKNYLLKVSIFGWGAPVVLVSVVLIINKDVYGSVSTDQSNSTKICFIRNDTIKIVTTLGLFGLVFLFNLILLMATVRNIVRMRKSRQFGPNDCNRFKKDICTLLGVISLLGTTWGLIFFSYGNLTTIGLYAFSILNPLQGLFIFVWFVLSVLKIRNASSTSTETQSSHGIGHK